MKLRKHEVDDLLDKALSQQLTPEEENRLQRYIQRQDGQAHALGHRALRQHGGRRGGKGKLAAGELSQIADQISGRVEKRRRRRRIVQPVVALATTAVSLWILILLFQLVMPSPAQQASGNQSGSFATFARTQPTAAPVVPAIFAEAARPFPEIFAEEYRLPVAEAQAAYGHDLLIPRVIPDNLAFVGSDLNTQAGALEMAFVEINGRGDVEGVWILSQRPVDEDFALSQPLPTLFQPGPAPEAEPVVAEMALDFADGPALFAIQTLGPNQQLPVGQYAAALSWLQEGQAVTLSRFAAQETEAEALIQQVEDLALVWWQFSEE